MKKIISLLTLITLIFLASVCVRGADTVTISDITPSDTSSVELVSGSSLTLSANVLGAQLVQFVLDEKTVAEFEGEAVYEHNIPMSELSVGYRCFKIVAYDADGNQYTDTSVFKLFVYTREPVNPGISTEPQTFDNISDKYAERTKDQALIDAFSDEHGWTLTGTDVYLQRVEGASGAEGDYAIKVIPYGEVSNASAVFKLDAWTQKVTSGIVVVDFDMMYGPIDGAHIQMQSFPLVTGSFITTEKKTNVYDTDFIAQTGQWIHFTYEYDVDNGTISISLNGDKYVNKAKAKAPDVNNNLSKFELLPQFWSVASYYTKNYWSHMTLDNFNVYIKNDEYTVSDYGYVRGGVLSSGSEVPFGSEALYVSLASIDGELTDSDVELLADGVPVAHGGITLDGSTVEVALPSGLSGGTELDLQIKSKSENGDAIIPEAVSAHYILSQESDVSYIFAKNGEVTSSNTSIVENDIVTADCTCINMSSSDKELLLIFAVRENDRIASISAKRVTVSAHDSIDAKLSLAPISRSISNAELTLHAIVDLGL